MITKLKNDRILPHNDEAEQYLLGALLLNNNVYEQISEILSPKHFASEMHQKIYEAMSKLISKGEIADPITLKNYLSFEDIDITQYLLDIAESVVEIENITDYAKIIYDLYVRRELINIGEDIVRKANKYDINEIAYTQIEEAEKKLFDLASGKSINRVVDLGNALNIAISNAEKAYQKDSKISGIPTGLIDMDKTLGGLHRSDLIILAGRPSMGKTALATNIAFNAALASFKNRNNKEPGGVAFFSLEMSSEQLATRILAQEASIQSEKIRKGEIKKEDFAKFIDISRQLSEIPLFIDDTPSLSIPSLRTKARHLKRLHGLDLIVVDYLQLMTSGNDIENRVLEISEITRSLKAVAKELDVPVLALSQLSRAVEQRDDKRPQLSDLRESGSIEQDADVVLFVFREEYYLARSKPQEGTEKHMLWQQKMSQIYNLAEVIIAKQRHGPIGTINLFFDSGLTKFGNLEKFAR